MKTNARIKISNMARIFAVTLFSLFGVQFGFANPIITMQPQSITVRSGTNASFFINATGTGTLSYFWQRAGAAVSGVNGPIYTITNAQMSDSGTQISCIVSNSAGDTQASSKAVLIVTASAMKIALVNPDNYRAWKCGENFGSYKSIANGTITYSGGNWSQSVVQNSANWTGLGQTPDYLTTLLTNAGYQVDAYWSSNFPSVTWSNYNLVIVQDPLANVGQDFGSDAQTNVPDVMYSSFSPAFLGNLDAYYNAGGAVLLVGNAVRLLENGTNRLNYGKQVIGQNAPNSVTAVSANIPSHWLFVQGAPFCCGYRSGTGNSSVLQSSLVASGGNLSTVSLVNGTDDSVGMVWCETIYHPTDAVSLLDEKVAGTANYTLDGSTCSPTVYQDSVSCTNQNVMGYTLVNGRRIYFIGSDTFFNLSFTDSQGTWHCGNAKTVQNQLVSSGTNAILGLIGQTITTSGLTPFAAEATAQVVNGFVVGATVFNSGFGYTNTPLVRFIGGGGSGAQGVAVVNSNGVVTGVNISNPGSGYTSEPIVVIAPPYIPEPVLNIAPMTFLSFSNLSISSSYQLQQLEQSYYWSNQPISFIAANSQFTDIVAGIVGSGDYRLALTPVPAQSFAIAQVVGGFVVGATVTAGGSGYVTAPGVNFIDASGSNATAVAFLSASGAVTNISIGNPGIHYDTNTTVQIDPPPAASVSPAMVLPMMMINSMLLAPYDNYQLQFSITPRASWGNWSGGLFIPTTSANSQIFFITNNTGFFRLEHLP